MNNNNSSSNPENRQGRNHNVPHQAQLSSIPGGPPPLDDQPSQNVPISPHSPESLATQSNRPGNPSIPAAQPAGSSPTPNAAELGNTGSFLAWMMQLIVPQGQAGNSSGGDSAGDHISLNLM